MFKLIPSTKEQTDETNIKTQAYVPVTHSVTESDSYIALNLQGSDIRTNVQHGSIFL
jgi:hypothetical protein